MLAAGGAGRKRKSSMRKDGVLGQDFFERDAVRVAEELIGVSFFLAGAGGTIVETEAYRHDDEASHSFHGPRRRCMTMFGPAGHLYVYRSYGRHWCLNLVCLPGSAVLVRALRPDAGIARMMERRATTNPRMLCSGPGRLCQALGIEGAHDGWLVSTPPVCLVEPPFKPAVVRATRIGISKSTDRLWRFGLQGSPWLSKPI